MRVGMAESCRLPTYKGTLLAVLLQGEVKLPSVGRHSIRKDRTPTKKNRAYRLVRLVIQILL